MIILPILALVLSASGSKDEPKADLAKDIIGEWALAKMVASGTEIDTKVPGDEPGIVYIFMDDGKYTSKELMGKGARTEKGTYKLDAAKSPAELRLSPEKGGKGKLEGIVKVSGDTLTICTGLPLPKKFESKKEDFSTLMEFKRVKKDK